VLFNSYYNAKLLLTGEYLVLNGAMALALPLRFGQRLTVEENKQGFISWQSLAHDGSTWFSGKYAINDFSIIESSNPDIAKHPKRLMLAARKINPDFCSSTESYNVISTLNYPLLWGLGSSSTLIAAIAGWAGIDPFQLHFEVSKGSGYDIACAISSEPIVYKLRESNPEFEPVKFSPSFADKIYFVYQGTKQDSAEGIQKYRNRNSNPDKRTVDAASSLTERMLQASDLQEFEQIMREHEILISSLLCAPTIRQRMFNDLPGEAKSLGAWGGDFCMLTWQDDPTLLSRYLKSKSLDTWFNYSDIVL
jgi:mevalonate kinase